MRSPLTALAPLLGWTLWNGPRRGNPGRREVCINSIDQDGTHEGYDLEITKLISDHVNIPVIASGGAGSPDHIADAFLKTGASAAIISSMLYSPKLPRNYHVSEIKDVLTAKRYSHAAPI